MVLSAPRRFLALLASAVVLGVAPAARAQVTVAVDVNADRKAISPLIYGVHFANTPTLLDMNATVNRYGGNSVGRYNWQQDIDNRGGDYFFKAFPYGGGQGGLGDNFIEATRAANAEPFLSMPMVGWVAKTGVGGGESWSFSVNDYGAFTGALGDAGNGCKAGAPLDNYHPCGNGADPQPGDGRPFTANDPTDASVPADVDFQRGWMDHIKNKYGAGNAGGLRYWGLDNEPSIWHTVYWDVHPVGPTAAEMRDKMSAYGERIKTVDPTAQVLGPEEWGWDGYFLSGRDQQQWGRNLCNGSINNCPDQVLLGADYVPWLLSEMKQYEDDNGTRVLDMPTLHIYPAGGEIDNGGSDVSPAMQLKRNASTRALWDVNYVDDSWINTEVKLIPRMRAWVAGSYPGTGLGLTEYDWGADNHINGATAEADVLGIFGREGLDMAIRWNVADAGPTPTTLAYNAFKMYRNYDGNKSTFGETSVRATVPNPDNVAAFAAQRADNTLTVMVINKQLGASANVTVNLANFSSASTAEVWQLTSANAITQLANVPVAANALTTTVPAQSITLFVIASTVVGPATADLAVTKTDGQTQTFPGQPLIYTIVASNNGPDDVTGATVVDTVPASISGPVWTCAGAGGGTCGAANGAGSINDTVNLPNGGSVTYFLQGNVAANPGPVVNTVTVAVPNGTTDSDPTNNSATDDDFLICDTYGVAVPDGRSIAASLTPSATAWYLATLHPGASYTVEAQNTLGTVAPAVTVFRGDDGCTGNSTADARVTSA
ncbi:MAG: glycoside hydrolase family 44 protein, partial [bacterium]